MAVPVSAGPWVKSYNASVPPAMRYSFVKKTLQQLITDGVILHQDSILVIAGARSEKSLFEELGLRHVTISNLDERLTGDEFAPFDWSFQDAQNLTFSDQSFAFVFVSDGLHHCASPHRALLEMYRVAEKGVIVFESRDSILMRAANRLNLTPSYELEAVVGNDFTHGGVDNSEIPNYIYRWTEREFQKTILSYNPKGRHAFKFFYGLNLPYSQAEMKKSLVKYFAIRIADPLLRAATRLFRRQCNSFGMVALKPRMPADLWPWLKLEQDRVGFDREYASEIFETQGGGFTAESA